MKWQDSVDKLEKIITKNSDIYKNHNEPRTTTPTEKKEISGPLVKVEIPQLDKMGRMSAREIAQKYKIPSFTNLKRLTPIPSQKKMDFNTVKIFASRKDDLALSVQVYEEESITTLETKSQNHIFLFGVDAFVDVEFLSKSKNVIFYNDHDEINLESFNVNPLKGQVEEILYNDYNVLIKTGQLKVIKGLALVKLVSENDQTYRYRLSIAEKLRNEFEFNSVLLSLVKHIMMDLREKMPKFSGDLMKRIQARSVADSQMILVEKIKDDIINDLEQDYIYSQTKAWIISNNILKR